jgi:hypothetical protein
MNIFINKIRLKRLRRTMLALLPQFSRNSFVSMGLIVCMILSRTGFIVTVSSVQNASTVQSEKQTIQSSDSPLTIESVSMVITSSGEMCGSISPSVISTSGCQCSPEKKRSGTCCCSSGNGCCSNKVAEIVQSENKSCCSTSKSKNQTKERLAVKKQKKQEGPAWIGCICGMSEFSFFMSFMQPMFKDKPVCTVSRNSVHDAIFNLNHFFDSLSNSPETPPPQIIS